MEEIVLIYVFYYIMVMDVLRNVIVFNVIIYMVVC